MIRRPLTVACVAAAALALLGAPQAMAWTGTDSGGSGSATCGATLAASAGAAGATVTGTVHCTADTALTLKVTAQGLATVQAASAVQAVANGDVAINATVPVPGCTKASATLVVTATGQVVASA